MLSDQINIENDNKNDSRNDNRSDNKNNDKNYDKNNDRNPMKIIEKLEKITVKGIEKEKNGNIFMWGLWQCENELTFLLDENDINSFPEGSLIVSPQRWRIIKLGGRGE